MLEYDWDNSVGHWVVSTSNALKKHIANYFLKEGITFRQWEVLAWLSNTGGCGSQSELADALGIEPHTMAGVINRMQRDGLLDRRSCDQDRRKNLIKPTAKAEELWRRTSRISHSFREEAVRGFSPEELEQLRDFLARIRENLDNPIIPVASHDPVELESAPAIYP